MTSDPILTNDGSYTLRHPQLGETYHARDGARGESLAKFILPSGIAERLRLGPLRLLDIGFGLGLNARCALECAVATAAFPLTIDSLEWEPVALDRALLLSPDDPLCLDVKRSGRHCAGPHNVVLHLGDARQVLQRLPGPWDLIFHDPFSPMKNTECWTQDFFALLRSKVSKNGALYTYSESRVVRAGLLAAGWSVENTPARPPQRGGTCARPSQATPPGEALPWRDPELRDTGTRIRQRRELAIRQNVC
jgi:tRNA U34 5-methylaminomethyl-2-thiouridine-forming methyltransferase MnmC